MEPQSVAGTSAVEPQSVTGATAVEQPNLSGRKDLRYAFVVTNVSLEDDLADDNVTEDHKKD